MSSKKPITEGPRQTGFRGDTPATDAISYKQPAAIVPFPDQNPVYGAPGTPNRADMADPNLPPSTGQMNPQPAPPQPARALPKPQKK